MDLANITKEALIMKLGTLMYANAELGAVNHALDAEVTRLNAVIEELKRAQPTITNGAGGGGSYREPEGLT